MLTDLCQELHNWFCEPSEIVFDTFDIVGGALSLSFLQGGQYYRIKGSRFNDGVHQYGVTTLTDETFEGTVWPMKIPQAFLDLANTIEQWQEKNGETVSSPIQNESWGGYSYSLKSGSGESGSVCWQSIFARQLNRWRKMQ